MCHVEKFHACLKWAEQKPRVFFIGMGDYDDLASASERMLLENKGFHDTTQKTLDVIYKDFTRKLYEELKFSKGQWIGLLEGNHYAVLKNGTTTTQYLAELLDTTYLGTSSFVRLTFEQNSEHTATSSLDLFLHHGRGGGRLAGSTINGVQKMMDIAEADIYLCGHDHQKGVKPLSRLRLNQGRGTLRLSHRKILLVRTGSFLRGYIENEESYIVDAAMPPTDLGVVKIELTPKRERREGRDWEWVDIHASV
jgi:hypothetical protein